MTMFEKTPLLAPAAEQILNSPVLAETQGPERVKALLFKQAYPSLLTGSTLALPRRASAQ